MKIVRLRIVILFFTIVAGSMMGNEITKTHNLPQNGVVQQINHYYPYGSLMGEGFNASSQPYPYGGKELVTLGGLNLSDFGARWLDSPSGTFTTMDPLCEDIQHLSPYLYCAGNPIKYIDPSGMEFTDVAQQYANRLITEAVLKIVGAIFGGSVFSNIQSLPVAYSNIYNKKMNATLHPNIKTIIRSPIIKKNNSLQNISKSTNHVFRIHEKTYWPN